MMSENLPLKIDDAEINSFITRNGFKFQYRIDPQVHCFAGTFLPPSVLDVLRNAKFFSAFVYVYVINNDDMGGGTTFKIELGLQESAENPICKQFGKSSPFCKTIDDAYYEAAMDLLYRRLDRKVPHIVAWQHRATFTAT